MRFSLRWILAATTYVAIAAAAFTQTDWIYADILWPCHYGPLCSPLCWRVVPAVSGK